MKAIIFEITMLVLVTGFIIFLAIDDKKNRQLRAEEDRQKALAEQEAKKKASDEADKQDDTSV